MLIQILKSIFVSCTTAESFNYNYSKKYFCMYLLQFKNLGFNKLKFIKKK